MRLALRLPDRPIVVGGIELRSVSAPRTMLDRKISFRPRQSLRDRRPREFNTGAGPGPETPVNLVFGSFSAEPAQEDVLGLLPLVAAPLVEAVGGVPFDAGPDSHVAKPVSQAPCLRRADEVFAQRSEEHTS